MAIYEVTDVDAPVTGKSRSQGSADNARKSLVVAWRLRVCGNRTAFVKRHPKAERMSNCFIHTR